MTQDTSNFRAEVAAAAAATLFAHTAVAAAAARLAKARATGMGDAAAAQAELDKAAAAAAAARAARQVSETALKDALEQAIGVQGAEVAPADVPVALLPVGLETRFSGDALLVRVIPDQIHVEDHEPALGDSEVDAGRAFWRSVWRGGTAEPAATQAERTAWATLAQAAGSARRAAWIADATAPTGGVRPEAPLATDAPLAEPGFPDPPRRPAVWSQPATARTLPDRFIAIAYTRSGSGGAATWTEIGRGEGNVVDDTVQLGFDPTAAPPPVDDSGPALPDGMRWLIDPAAAERTGLLVRIPLPPGTARIDRLVVVGVLGTLDPAASAGRLTELLAGHHYATGLAVLPVGTPSNNTAADTSAFRRRDDPLASFAIERRTPVPPDGSDGALLARALGIPPTTLRGVAGSNEVEQAAAGQMNALLWPAAMGYWLDSLIQPGPSDAVIADLRRHAVQMVRGRGPLPPLRIGRQPYGVLPVTSLSAWQPHGDPAGVVAMVGIMRQVLPWWREGVGHAPVVRADADPDHGILDALSQLPVSSEVGVRSMVGANACYIPNGLGLGGDAAKSAGAEANRQRWMALLGLRAMGITGFPYIGQLVGHADPIATLHLPYTVDPRLAPADAAAAWAAVVVYLKALRGRRTSDFKAEDPRQIGSLLALLARRSVMLERVRAGLVDTVGHAAGQLIEAHLRTDAAAVIAAAMIPTTATLRVGQTLSAASAVMASNVRQADGSLRGMIDYIDQRLVIGGIIDPVHNVDYADTVAAVEAVAGLAPDRAALLLGEALDTASHRFDAWITSLATRRLSELRAATPAGITLGAYGAVEELTRRPARPTATPAAGVTGPLSADADGGGYIHAASLAQAATAAVLRAGHLSHAGRDPASAALAIDLTSARVRAALGLLDGVRQGQSLGALLGYRAERQLHDLGAHTAVEVVRALAPPPVVTAEGLPEGLPPRAVCDGLALSRLDRATVIARAGADSAAVAATLDALDDAVDAVADLLLAESVHQIVRGNPERAAAALDTLNRGEGAVVEPDVVRTPRTGTSLTQRLLIAIGPDAPPAPGWPADGIRAAAEPRVSAWAGHLLGDAHAVPLVVTDGGGAAITLTFGDLGLGALDVVYEPLAARVLRHARARGASETAAFDPSSPDVAALLAMADLLRGLLTRARPGSGLDFARPQDRGGVVTGAPPADAAVLRTDLPDVDRGDRRARLDAVRDRLQAAIAALPDPAPGDTVDEGGIADALDALAAFGLAAGSDPRRRADGAAVAALKAAALARLAAATAAPDDAAALFGDGFPVLALAAAPFPIVVNAALAVDPLAAGPAETLAALGGRDQTLATWLEMVGRVRAGAGRLADVLLAARLRGAATPATLRAFQLPVEPFPSAGEAQRGQWVGLGFPAALGPEPVTSFVLHALGSIDAAAGVALLALDEYSEVVPAPTTTTAVSFSFDAPGARPPQTILLAVPPVAGTPWTVDGLAAVVGETLDLAKIRMVDLSSVAWVGRFLPTVYLTDGDVASGLDLPMKDLVTLAHTRFAAFKNS